MFYIKKVLVEAITFDEFVQYGIDNKANMSSGTPWSFYYKGRYCLYYDENSYTISPGSLHTFNFTRNDLLVTENLTDTYVVPVDEFNLNYVLAM